MSQRTLSVLLVVLAIPFLAVRASALPRPEQLPVNGFGSAVLVPPAGAGARPVVVGLHGNFDRPEWLCGALRPMVAGEAWILCPRGVPRRDVPRELDRWTFGGRPRVMRELEAALAALREAHPGRVAARPLVLGGFSLGAILSARFAVARPQRFPRLYLAEGSYNVWTPKNMRRFARRGGEEVVFGCGRPGCAAATRRICKSLKKLGVACHSFTAPGLGHSYTGSLPGLAGPQLRRMVTSTPPRDRPARP